MLGETPFERRFEEFKAELERERDSQEISALKTDARMSLAFKVSMAFSGLAVLCGFIPNIQLPYMMVKPEPFPSWLISIFAAVSAGSTFYVRQGKLRAKADWHYAVRDAANQILLKLRFEMPNRTDPELAKLSAEWRKKRDALGAKMVAINAASPTGGRRDEPQAYV